MTRQEFIDRTGFTPTEDHFKAIHEEYMAAGDGVDKDTFCERWLKNNGPQQAYDWMHSRLEGTEGELAAAKETNRELDNRIADLGDIIDRKDEETGETTTYLEDFVYAFTDGGLLGIEPVGSVETVSGTLMLAENDKVLDILLGGAAE